MINLDMVGRLNDDQLTIYGTGTAAEFDELVDQLNQTYQFDLTKKSSGFGPSDHTSFYSKQVPVLFPFTGLHRDYHRPSDDWDKINVAGLCKVTDFSLDIIEAIEAMPQRPTYVKRGRWGSMFDDFRRGPRPRRTRRQPPSPNGERESREVLTDERPADSPMAVEPAVAEPAIADPAGAHSDAQSPAAAAPATEQASKAEDQKPEKK